MRKIAAVVLVIAVAVMFSVPAFAGDCDCAKTCPKPAPCNTCPKPCTTCGQPDNVLQSTANVINKIEAPDLSCACPKPCAKPCNTCPKPAAKPCNTCTK